MPTTSTSTISSVQSCVAEHLQQESGEDPVEVVSESDEDEDDVGCAKVEVSREEALSMIDKLVNLIDLNKEERGSLVSPKEKLEIIKINSRKQKSIKDFFK